MISFEDLVTRMTNHPMNRHVLAAAIKSRAQIIVTFNLKHFQLTALHSYYIEPQSPDIFLMNLLAMNPEQMLNIIAMQARDLHKPTTTIATLLENLAFLSAWVRRRCAQSALIFASTNPLRSPYSAPRGTRSWTH